MKPADIIIIIACYTCKQTYVIRTEISDKATRLSLEEILKIEKEHPLNSHNVESVIYRKNIESL